MPHFVLEYSSNIREKIEWQQFFLDLHGIACECAPINLDDLKSRAVPHHDFLVGDGSSRKAFVFLTLKLLSGREPQALKTLGSRVMGYLKERFAISLDELNCSVTFEIREMSRELHFKAG